MKHKILPMFLIFMSTIWADVIKDVSFIATEDGQIEIMYYFSPPKGHSCIITVFTTCGNNDLFQLVSVSGDTGTVSSSGYKKIKWDVFKDREDFQGNCSFKVSANEIIPASEAIANLFTASEALKKEANGHKLECGYDYLTFTNSFFNQNKKSGFISGGHGIGLNYYFTHLPFLALAGFSHNGFDLPDNVSVTADWSFDIAGLFSPILFSEYFIPYFGVGYQISALSGAPTGPVSNSDIATANISGMYFITSTHSNFGYFGITFTYKKTLNSYMGRSWERLYFGINVNITKMARAASI